MIREWTKALMGQSMAFWGWYICTYHIEYRGFSRMKRLEDSVKISYQNAWDEDGEQIMLDGCLAMFKQNLILRDFLLSTNWKYDYWGKLQRPILWCMIKFKPSRPV